MELKKRIKTRRGWESLKNPTPTTERCRPLSGLQRNALASLVHFVTYTTKRTRDASALRWRPERGRHRSVVGVGFLRLSHPRLVFILFSAPSLLQMKFFQKLFPPCFCSFWGGGGGCKPIFKYSSFHLQIRYHTADKRVIASDEIASATHLRTRYHTADKRVYR